MVKELNEQLREARKGFGKPFFFHTPNDGSGVQKIEFDHRPVEVNYPPEMDLEIVKLYTEAFIDQLPRNIRPVIFAILWSKFKYVNNEQFNLTVILDKPNCLEPVDFDLKEMKDRLSLDVMEAFQKFGWKLVNNAGVFNEEVSLEESTMTLVYRQVDPLILGQWLAVAE